MPLKYLLTAIALGANLLGGPAVPQQQNATTNTKADIPSKDKQPIPPTHVIIDPPFPAVASQTEPRNEQSSSKAEPLPWWKRPEWVIVYVTAAYALIAFATLLAIKKQADLTQASLILTFRPRLILRRVTLHVGTAIPTMGIPDDDPWRVDYTIANIGGSTAHITNSSFAQKILDDGIPAVPPYGECSTERNCSLRPGEEREFFIELEKELIDLFRLLGVKRGYLSHQKTAHVYFLGYAFYRDDLRFIRKMAVLRHYDTETGRFVVVDDADYNYSD